MFVLTPYSIVERLAPVQAERDRIRLLLRAARGVAGGQPPCRRDEREVRPKGIAAPAELAPRDVHLLVVVEAGVLAQDRVGQCAEEFRRRRSRT